jgi:hypothetical protein
VVRNIKISCITLYVRKSLQFQGIDRGRVAGTKQILFLIKLNENGKNIKDETG